MSFKSKYLDKQTEDDSFDALLCSVPGCVKRWTVHMSGDKPKCSHHQWTEQKPATLRDIALTLPNKPKTKQWYDNEL